MNDDQQQRALELARLRLVADWMDRRFVDPLLGLFLPGGGNMVGSLVGLYGVAVALRQSAHPIVVARMLLNLAFDALLGCIPILGAIGDFFFRAHLRNVALLEQRRDPRVRPSDWFVVLGAAFLFFFALALPLLLAVWLLSWLAQQF